MWAALRTASVWRVENHAVGLKTVTPAAVRACKPSRVFLNYRPSNIYFEVIIGGWILKHGWDPRFIHRPTKRRLAGVVSLSRQDMEYRKYILYVATLITTFDHINHRKGLEERDNNNIA